MSSLSLTKGFTLIELLVSIAIMAIITTVVGLNQSQLGGGAALKNITNNLSLSIRQAQIFGISVKQSNPDPLQTYSTNNFNTGYGVHFDINPPPSGDNTSYLLFVDKRGPPPPTGGTAPNQIYAGVDMVCVPSDTSECLDKVTMSGGYFISALCTLNSGVEECDKLKLDISFIRPAIEARLVFDGISGSNVACIEVSSPDGKKNAVVVYITGQISVRNMSCTDAI